MEEAEEERPVRAEVTREIWCHHGVMGARRGDFRREWSAVAEAALRPSEFENVSARLGDGGSLKRTVV